MRTSIHVRCDNQVLSYVEKPFIASGDVNEDRIEFEFCPLWEGFIKTAVFYRNEADVYHVLLDEEDGCIIPHEVLADPGAMYFGVFGEREGRVKTSEIIQYTVRRGAITEATKVSDPTPDIYAQILELLRNGGTGGGATDEESLTVLIETDMLPAVHSADGKILADENGKIILRY